MRDTRERNIGIMEVSQMTQAISHYYGLGSYFRDLNRNNSLEENFNNYITSKKADEDYWKSSIVQSWNRIDFHMIDQMWGSTSCGWGGIGGAAMSNEFNMVIENKYNNLFFVYWNGKLAYVAEMDDKVDYGNLPRLDSCEKVLKVLYKGK